jgi:hypothetical protein
MNRPVLPAHQPTEVAPTYQPTEVAPSYQPTEVAPSYQPTEVAPSYQPTEAAPSYQPTEQAPSYQPTMPPEAVPPAYPPTQAAPRRPVPPSRSNPTVMAPQVRPNADPREQATVMPSGGAFAPPPPPTNIDPSRPPAPHPAAAAPPASDLMRYGPGVPPSQAGVSAEQVWRTGHMPDPPKRPVRYRRLASLILTVVLLAAAGVLLFLRFHHSPFKVTGVPTLQTAQNGCTVNVTGKIPTNGSSGTISYQWVFTPQQSAPQPLSQSVVSGAHDAFVTVAVQGQGHGTASEQVTLQVLGPNQERASTVVKVSC